MTASSPDRRLSAELSRLPAARASADFTARVLARIEAPPRRPHPGLRWAAAAAAAALALLALLPRWHQQPDRTELARQAEALRLEHDALRQELEALRSLADETTPVLYLDGDERYEYVVDLRPMLIGSTTSPGGAVPAARRGDNP